MIDFEIPADVERLREKVRGFVRGVAIPAERRDDDPHGLPPAVRAERAAGREAFG